MVKDSIRGWEVFLAVAAMTALAAWMMLQKVRQPADLKDTDPLSKFASGAVSTCANGSDAYLRTASQFAFKWDEIGFFEQKFDHVVENVVKGPDDLVLSSNKISIQNQYGAFQRVTIYCFYNTKTEKAEYWLIQPN